MLVEKVYLLARMSTIGARDKYYLHICRHSKHTYIAYTRAIDGFVKGAPKFIKQVKTEHIEQYIIPLSKKYAARSVNVYLAAIKSWFRWLNENEGIEDVAKKIQFFRTLPPNQRILSKAEYDKVVEAATGYAKDVIQFLSNTGLRSQEFLDLKPNSIGRQFITIVGKGRRQRAIPINHTVKQILKDDPDINFAKSVTNYKALSRLCHKAAKQADIDRFSPHSLRHFFSDSLHRKGVSTSFISKLLGHSNILTTEQIYIHWQDENLLGVTDVLDH